ncbi:MAG: isoleucine--tRNA ligase [Gemmatimonadota bacterium]|nr:isoleucine--tRNA ligase [Gemmatimonadota bacterium]
MSYPPLPDSIGALEQEVLERWTAEDTFHESLRQREGAPSFVFYEGPPTANGRPGVHHVLARTIKDTVARHRAMCGFHVTRIAGWDTHGLPVEIEAEKHLGISGKPEIERIGIAEFNRICRENVFTYKEDWERLSRRIGYWLDYDRPYVTFTPEYVESVWWALSEIDRKGLLYRGHKVLPYCPRCGTGLSSHEVAQGYADRTDPSVTVRFPVAGEPGRYLLVWTTTPWTLVSNVAVAFGPDVPYVEVEREGERYVLGRSRVASLLGEDARVVRDVEAAELAELVYERPLDLLPSYRERTGRLVPAGFVSDAEGTGLVHIAPAFGADDFELGRSAGLPVVRPVDDAGRFEPDVREVGGRFVKDADERLLELLDARGLLERAGTLRHSYPHCWRCESPLLYVARDSWYIRTTAVKDRLLAHNASVRWQPPEIGAGRMGEWLENNVDWAISRDRYWGTPLPVWVCDADDGHREVPGSFARLAELAGPLPDDFDPHRPGIDELAWTCTRDGCAGTMRRVPEVVDTWFDSGAMPFAQWHYPFAARDAFERHFPADFIAEGVDQTRGWFYSLLAISTLLFDRPAYRAVIVNDLVLDESGQKMSKSRGNVVDPAEALAEHGADAIRFYLLASSNPWLPKRWDAEGLRETNRKLFDTLRSVYRFFALYAGLEDWSHEGSGAAPPEDRPVLDRWLLSRLDDVTGAVRRDLDGYDLTRAARRVADFVLDDLSNWYVRRSRERFWATRPGAATDLATSEAFATLHEALRRSALLLAPFAPFLADWLHRSLRDGASVHLADYPEPAGRHDPDLEAGMEDVRALVRLGRAAREEAGIRVRQPLGSMRVILPGERRLSPDLEAVLRDELNIRNVEFPSGDTDIVRLSAKPDFGRLGPRFGPRTPLVAEAIRELAAGALRSLRSGEAVQVALPDGEVDVMPDEVRVVEEGLGGLTIEAADGYLVALDVTVTEELRAEGVARELVSRVQRLRREAGLAVSDRIVLAAAASAQIETAVRAHEAWIAGETLAVRIGTGPEALRDLPHRAEVEIDGETAAIGLGPAPGDRVPDERKTRTTLS